jgi:limonene-1,2-epoxide hydrolase
MVDAVDVTRPIAEFFARWDTSYDELCASMHDAFSDECVWHNPGFPPSVGPAGAIAGMVEPFRAMLGLDTIGVEVTRLECAGGAVWSERIDTLRRADRRDIAIVPVVGVMRLADDGRISHWREYFDTKPLFELMAQQNGALS